MSRRIEIQLQEDGHHWTERIQEAAQQHGIHLPDEGSQGQFAGKGVEGTYEIDGGRLVITISKKPLLLPWAIIEHKVRKFFEVSSPELAESAPAAPSLDGLRQTSHEDSGATTIEPRKSSCGLKIPANG